MGQKERLKGFINLLNKHINFNFNINKFNDRLKLQKYVFIGKFFGFEHNYIYNLYIRGPYSSGLASDYYDIYHERIASDNSIEVDVTSFASLVQGKNIDWLESAATMLSLYSSNKWVYHDKNNIDAKRLIKGTNRIKHKIDINTIKTVFSDLKKYNLFN